MVHPFLCHLLQKNILFQIKILNHYQFVFMVNFNLFFFYNKIILGIGTLIGRILFGFLSDFKFSFKWGKNVAKNRLFIYSTTLIVCGLSSSLIFLIIENQLLFFIYCFFFGFVISSYICLSSVIAADLINVDQLINGFGILLFIQGISTLFGTPIGGLNYYLYNLKYFLIFF